jgi:hypothetical protein
MFTSDSIFAVFNNEGTLLEAFTSIDLAVSYMIDGPHTQPLMRIIELDRWSNPPTLGDLLKAQLNDDARVIDYDPTSRSGDTPWEDFDDYDSDELIITNATNRLANS